MNMNPRKAIVGPTTIRRVENMSGLNASVVLLPPSISRKPMSIVSPGYRHQYKVDFGQGEAAARLCLNYVPGIFVGTCIIVWCHICV